MQQELRKEYDLVIVGAGLAGLSSAYHIKKKYPDLSILIVEGKGRVGGRTCTESLKCTKSGKKSEWDTGGQWVTGTQTYVMELIKEFGLETYKQYTDGKKVLEVGAKIRQYKSSIPRLPILSLIDLQWIITKFNMAAKRMSTLYPFETMDLANHLDSNNLEQYLYANSLSSNARGVIEAACRAIFGLESNQINALFGLLYGKSGGGSMESLSLTEKDCGQELRVKGGTQQISKILLERTIARSDAKYPTHIVYETALREIHQSEEDESRPCQVVIQDLKTLKKETISARKVISAIPISEYANIKFTPELPNYKRNVFKHCLMGNYTKVIVTYEEAFWRKKGFSGEVVSDGSVIDLDEEKFQIFYADQYDKLTFNKQIPSIGSVTVVYDATTNSGEAALVVFRTAKQEVEWADHSVEVRRNEIINALVRYFGPEARDYVDFVEKQWSTEPFTGGCPTVCATSSGSIMKDYVRATREPFLNVHFAGTESATQWQGYMDGAIESSHRVVNEVLYSMYGNEPSMKVDFERTYYHQKRLIQDIIARNNRRQYRISFSFLSKVLVYVTIISVFGFVFLSYLGAF